MTVVSINLDVNGWYLLGLQYIEEDSLGLKSQPSSFFSLYCHTVQLIPSANLSTNDSTDLNDRFLTCAVICPFNLYPEN